MKKPLITLLLGAAISLAAATQGISAQSPAAAASDSIETSLRLNILREKKEKLQREIKLQDSKRNRQIAGVSAETLEAMNDRQDSLCLALRSRLADVVLEIKELSPGVASPQLINQYNNLMHRPDSTVPAPAAVQPVKPVKPTKPVKPVKPAKK